MFFGNTGEVRIALTLRKKLSTFVDMRDEGAFLRECEEEAMDLVPSGGRVFFSRLVSPGDATSEVESDHLDGQIQDPWAVATTDPNLLETATAAFLSLSFSLKYCKNIC